MALLSPASSQPGSNLPLLFAIVISDFTNVLRNMEKNRYHYEGTIL